MDIKGVVDCKVISISGLMARFPLITQVTIAEIQRHSGSGLGSSGKAFDCLTAAVVEEVVLVTTGVAFSVSWTSFYQENQVGGNLHSSTQCHS